MTATSTPAVPKPAAPKPVERLARRPLPGDLGTEAQIARIIRVDQAGEYGAARIYAGQLSVLGKSPVGATIRHMEEQERVHLDTFNQMMVKRRVRPTALQPLWKVAGYALGAATALMGERAAMACTVAVEEAIDAHYAEQAERLGPGEAELKATIEKFRAEELEHRDIGLAHDAELTTGYPVLYTLIKAGTRAVIWVAERV
ncbi:demethoxyubiquinone hydroxylase family protein [Nitrospirillum viridazoti]|uniref:3-demethoxyubiquinol 3-hydroxylase n=2 Tax=Nitrospirillum TaxID=1543705 RepID=A0A560I176_9PROT|nr:demethoxyubiquinone hydroxylase family protein [Nitrospirillum amazonense]TWB52676.1 ubiquinone biosynthesis monooxygenase Coq7 [Nitrospirillum amazonense]